MSETTQAPERVRLIPLVYAIEWAVLDSYDKPSFCPSCWGGRYSVDHAPDCQLRAAIARYESANQERDDALRAASHNADWTRQAEADMRAAQAERDALRAEVERLMGVLEQVRPVVTRHGGQALAGLVSAALSRTARKEAHGE